MYTDKLLMQPTSLYTPIGMSSTHSRCCGHGQKCYIANGRGIIQAHLMFSSSFETSYLHVFIQNVSSVQIPYWRWQRCINSWPANTQTSTSDTTARFICSASAATWLCSRPTNTWLPYASTWNSCVSLWPPSWCDGSFFSTAAGFGWKHATSTGIHTL